MPSASLQPAFNQPSTSLQPAFNQPSTSLQPAFNQPSTSLQPALYVNNYKDIPVIKSAAPIMIGGAAGSRGG
jgi:hypothetical protein